MTINDRGPGDLALRALRDCGTIRVRLGAVARGYQLAQRAGCISSRRVGDTHADIRLSVAGHQLAGQLKPWDQTA